MSDATRTSNAPQTEGYKLAIERLLELEDEAEADARAEDRQKLLESEETPWNQGLR